MANPMKTAHNAYRRLLTAAAIITTAAVLSACGKEIEEPDLGKKTTTSSSSSMTSTAMTSTTTTATTSAQAEGTLETKEKSTSAKPSSIFTSPGQGYQCPGTDAWVTDPVHCTPENLGGEPYVVIEDIYPDYDTSVDWDDWDEWDGGGDSYDYYDEGDADYYDDEW